MNCEEIQNSLDFYLDGELAHVERWEFESHVGQCPGCAELLEQSQQLKADLLSLSETPIPGAMQMRISEALSSVEIASASCTRPKIGVWRGTAMIAAATLVAAGAFLLVREQDKGIDGEDPTAEEDKVAGYAVVNSPIVDAAVQWHLRDAPMEVVGPDPVRVGDWFDNQVDFPVHLPSVGHLLGARLGNVSEHEAAVAEYDVDGEDVSVILVDSDAFPLQGEQASGSVLLDTSAGYNVALYVRDGVTYTFTSEMPADALMQVATEALNEAPALHADRR